MSTKSRPPLRLTVLGSGSSGNCVAIEGPEGIILLDAGFSPRQTRTRLELCGLSPASVRAVVLTHPDTDHLNHGWKKSIGGLTGPRLLVRARHAETVKQMGYESAWIDEFTEPFEIAGIHFAPFPLPHDSLGSTAFRISVGACTAAHATDCGRVTPRLADFLAGADILFLESNYDPHLQRNSGRHPFLIERIMNGRGHLSNEQALNLAASVDAVQALSTLVLLHLSRQCNCPDLVRGLYSQRAPQLLERLTVSLQHQPTPMLVPVARLHRATLFDSPPQHAACDYDSLPTP